MGTMPSSPTIARTASASGASAPASAHSRLLRRLVLTLAVAAAVAVPVAAASETAARVFAGVADADAGAPIDSALGTAPGTADGVVERADASVFDDLPAVTGLQPDLRTALRDAAADAEADGVRFVVNSGWRSARLQERLLDEAVARYGSREEAARWVATPETSAHVTGDAIDLGPWDALDWLAQRGARYGLCQIYANEPWHWELRPEAASQGCPAMYGDPTEDPRLR